MFVAMHLRAPSVAVGQVSDLPWAGHRPALRKAAAARTARRIRGVMRVLGGLLGCASPLICPAAADGAIASAPAAALPQPVRFNTSFEGASLGRIEKLGRIPTSEDRLELGRQMVPLMAGVVR